MSVRSDVAFECAVWRGQAATYQSLCTDLLQLNAVACCLRYVLAPKLPDTKQAAQGRNLN